MRSALSVLMRCRRSRMYRAEVNSSSLGEGSSALGLPLMSDVWIWTQTNTCQFCACVTCTHTYMLVDCIRLFTKIYLKTGFCVKQKANKTAHLPYVRYSQAVISVLSQFVGYPLHYLWDNQSPFSSAILPALWGSLNTDQDAASPQPKAQAMSRLERVRELCPKP